MEAKPLKVGELRVGGKSLFQEWFTNLDRGQQTEIDKRLVRLRLGNLGDHRNLSGGILELKFRSGIRLYCGRDGERLIILICGGNKASGKRGQDANIKLAQGLWAQYTKGKVS
jgi:putative addiction module killer protein